MDKDIDQDENASGEASHRSQQLLSDDDTEPKDSHKKTLADSRQDSHSLYSEQQQFAQSEHYVSSPVDNSRRSEGSQSAPGSAQARILDLVPAPITDIANDDDSQYVTHANNAAGDDFMTDEMNDIERQVQNYEHSLNSDTEQRASFQGDGFLSYSGPRDDAQSGNGSLPRSRTPSGDEINYCCLTVVISVRNNNTLCMVSVNILLLYNVDRFPFCRQSIGGRYNLNCGEGEECGAYVTVGILVKLLTRG